MAGCSPVHGALDHTAISNRTASVTIVKNPGDPNMQVMIKDEETIKVLNMTEQIMGGQGSKIGTAYRLESGEVIYMPENGTG